MGVQASCALLVVWLTLPVGPLGTLATSGAARAVARRRSCRSRNGPCPSCTALIDQLDAAVPHVAAHASMAVVAKAPIERLATFGRERGWRNIRLLSSHRNTYAADYNGEVDGQQLPMMNVFTRDGDVIRHFWGSEMLYAPTDPGQDTRHLGTIEPAWNLFDLMPRGRGGLGRGVRLRLLSRQLTLGKRPMFLNSSVIHETSGEFLVNRPEEAHRSSQDCRASQVVAQT